MGATRSAGHQELDHRRRPSEHDGAAGHQSVGPGPSGNEQAPNHANYDESQANPFPHYPELLKLNNGSPVTTGQLWWGMRRAEIVEEFEREVLGRVPDNAPKITWKVTKTTEDKAGPYPVVAREITGLVDNSAAPDIQVEIQLVVVRPAWVRRPVPMMIMFGRAALPSAPLPVAFARFAPPPGSDPAAAIQLVAAGWGYAMLNPTRIQADNGAGLTKGVIGIANQGRPRKPDDWGALRAWAWGASRVLDYLEGDSALDARKVGIEGVSRYGKAALVTMALDARFAVALVASSGEGGTKPHRRNFGEAVENLTGSGEYHWMAGNFLRHGAAESTFGAKNAGDIPVDSHQLIALCAPRATFISYGVPEKGDARWLDQQGSFMAAVAAGPVFRLLGAPDLGVTEDYRRAKMPPVNVGLLSGRLAWRQHDGGHTDGPNRKYFIPWWTRGSRCNRPARFNVSAKTAAKWVRRYREAGAAGLSDRSSRPRRLRQPTMPEMVNQVESLRRERWTGRRIAQQTGLSRATVSRILRRLGLSRMRDLEPRPLVQRYEHARPGDLLHLDIKKLGRIARPSHRVTGNRRDSMEGIGWE